MLREVQHDFSLEIQPGVVILKDTPYASRRLLSRSTTQNPAGSPREEEFMKPQEIIALYEFNAWANHKTLHSVSALTTEQFTRDLGSSYRSVRDTLVHIHLVEWIWLERLHGRSPAAFPATEEFPDVVKLKSRWADLEALQLQYARTLTQADLDEVLEYKTLSFGPGRNPRWQMIQHVVNHGSYHRGQVTTMLRQLGAQAVSTDLISFYRERNAAA
jgi:uncharacterized damage-inducible protein DinB